MEEYEKRILELTEENSRLSKKILELNRSLATERKKPKAEDMPAPKPEFDGNKSGVSVTKVRIEEYEQRILELIAEN